VEPQNKEIACFSFSCFFITKHNIGILDRINQVKIIHLFGFYHGISHTEQTAMTTILDRVHLQEVVIKMEII
jgi:hypothetical protein